MTISFFILIAAILLSVPLRIWQYLNLIDPTTGFYSSNHPTIWILAFVLIASSLAIVFFTVREKNLMGAPMQYGTKSLGMAYILLSGAMTYSCVQKMLFFVSNGKTLKDVVFAALSFLCAVSFVILAFLFIVDKTGSVITRILLIVPVVWSISVLWNTFVGYQTILTISEHLFEIVGFIFIVLYNLSFAFVVSGFGAESHQKRMMIYGSIGSLFCIMNSVAKIFILIKTKTSIPETLPTYLLYLSFGIFMIVSIGYLCFGTDRSVPMKAYDEIFDENVELYAEFDRKKDFE